MGVTVMAFTIHEAFEHLEGADVQKAIDTLVALIRHNDEAAAIKAYRSMTRKGQLILLAGMTKEENDGAHQS